MNFDFSEDQKFLKDQADKFLSERCTLKTVRAVMEGGAPYDKALWAGIVEMGWTGTVIPEAYGGLGLGYLELCVIAEALGRALAPVPFSSSVYLATEALLLAGSEAQKQEYLPKLASGASIGTFALAEQTGPVTPRRVTARFANGKLEGTKIAVPDGLAADFCIVAARTEEAGDRSLSLVLVDLTGPGVTRRAEESIDPTRPLTEIRFSGAPATLLGKLGDGWAMTRNLFDRAAVLTAFEQVAGTERVIEMTRDYVLNRYAFGRSLGSFQAIKHKLADFYAAGVLARSNAYYGAWALSNNAAELPLAAAGARISACAAYDLASQEGLHLHGGVGFTWEYDCHIFYRRARQLALGLGAPRVWKERLVSELEKSNAA